MAIETPVLIVGGGPVGLTLGIDLAWRGTPALIVERRIAPTEHPKATLLGSRSMELYRRWGLDGPIFEAALPPDENYHILFTTRLARHELHRFTSPSLRQVRDRTAPGRERFRELAWSPYSKTQIGQQALEPVLLRRAEAQDRLALLRGWRCTGLEQDGDGVTARMEAEDGGGRETVRARWAVACDGGTSDVRRALGIPMVGRGRMRANTSFYFRSADFLKVHGRGVANLYFVFTADSFGVFTAIDGRELWNYQYYFLDPAKEREDLDARTTLHRAMGAPFDFELLATTRWHHHQSVATRWRHGRIFLAGDAAHLFSPTGGVGMNTGIGDACDLAWKLDAAEKGWAGDWLLDSYEAERKPVAIRNSLISATNSDKIDMVMAETPADIDREDARGAALRRELTGRIRWLARQFDSAGTHLGYRYAGSPIVVPDGTPEPPDDPAQVVPSAWPGSRAPHVWLDAGNGDDGRGDAGKGDEEASFDRGRSTLDLFGRDWVLLGLGRPPADAAGLVDAAEAAGLPLRRVGLDHPEMLAVCGPGFVLVRPDGHVAWRAAEPPDRNAAAAIVARIRGATEPDHPPAGLP